ncbi:DUF1343 domain-containing protein [Clostridium swellfunianum]|uniref:exo-beta-N-acetylmuramidase NamZ family protein n=1 Tax=Clostridium swellfunianum TaxID=1367462 RepID=UPI00202F9328|nr:DUF1343 domain-containing protein [Clostridium swellfunianum]MCM0649032.1 DUF1343 domain-containing protein [Clostridium swellfunianum]
MEKLIVRNGIDNLDKYTHLFEGKRIGLVSCPTGVDKNLKSTIDILNEKFNLTALYSPEHGIRGNLQAGAAVDNYIDEGTGITVYSLYGNNKKPSPEVLKDIDVMVIDLQDIGSRYYTFLYTMSYCMESCAENNKAVVVLDRPNVIGGQTVEGNILNIRFKSFVGMYPIPPRYGLTIGEMAKFMNKEFNINCNLEIVKLEGWNREAYFDDTDLLWINPSPNMPSVKTAVLYNGTCLFEGTNISEGRGTTRPFEFVGAPWLDAYKLADTMNEKGLEGVIFRPIYFEPTFSKHKGELCKGVQVHVTDKRKVKPVELGIHLLYEVMDMDREKFQWLAPFKEGGHHFIDFLSGTDAVRNRELEAEGFIEKWKKESNNFKRLKEKYHEY